MRLAPESPPISIVDRESVKYTLVLGNEYGDKKTFSITPRPAAVAHVQLVTTLRSQLTPEAVERIESADARFQVTVAKLIRSCRLLSLS